MRISDWSSDVCSSDLTAEVAVSVHRDWKAQGIGWSLLRHAAQIARATGISRLQSIESRDNHAAIEVERDLGFTARACPGDGKKLVSGKRGAVPVVPGGCRVFK